MTIVFDACIDILINPYHYENPENLAWEDISAAQTAIERILGAPTGSLPITSQEALAAWFDEQVPGTADGDVLFSHAEVAYRSIPNAQLHRMEGAWHLLWVDDGAEEMVQTQIEFAKAHFEET